MSAAAYQVKGWCPGALRPMASGDGLLVRIKPWCGALTLPQAAGLADIAERLGNGQIDLTRRANLQIRGLAEADMAGLQDALDRLGLLDRDAETEAARNMMVGPFAGAEARALAAELSHALSTDRRLSLLPAKFAWLVDGGMPSILAERSNVALCLTERGVALRLGTRWLGIADREGAVAAALDLARQTRPALAPLGDVPVDGPRLAGVAAPFGRLEAPQLRKLAALAAAAGASEMRLSPWRALYFDGSVRGVSELGLIIDPGDPLLRIDACPGYPACSSSSVDTRRDAMRLARRGFVGTLHVSGCTKGCARSAPADLVLVGEGGRYGVVERGTARDRPQRFVAPEDL